MTPYRLHYAPDNASLCVRLALLRAGVPFETVLVNRRTRQQDSPAYKALNPNGLIPVLETPDGPIYETGAILLWIADRYGMGLAPPPDHPDRGKFLTWLFWMANTLHPALRMIFYPDKYIAGDTGPLLDGTRRRVSGLLDLLDQQAPSLAPWLGGERASILDCYLAPMLRWLPVYDEAGAVHYDLARRPTLAAILRRMDERPETHDAARAEGLGPNPFSAPTRPNPPEGSAQ